jgi:hypothetical protein
MIPYLASLDRKLTSRGVIFALGRRVTLLTRIYLLACFSALISACSTIATYDQTAYLQAINTKVDALALMDKALDPYSSHQSEVVAFQLELDKAYEYERGRPLNRDTIAQWDLLRDPNRDLLSGFLSEWKQDGPLKPVYIKRKKAQIGKAFDEIVQLESGKIKTAPNAS